MPTCARCNRKLTNPHSIARQLGPKCYKLADGGIFDSDLQADEKEWARREEHLRRGGEIDFGTNWRYPLENGFSVNMRISVRYRDGAFEAYGVVFDPRGEREIVFARSEDLKAIYREAIATGPTYTAMAYQSMKEAKRQARKGRMAV
ncbi:hypothetical protein SAMN00808754_2074 [Thermanaeromonas toyohensis ToBE]|uniref:Uncharacterized protein n=1 Tax=Thermanaeromonas toyohensis ToBE TaxID=698762 RepID=A0A1W1VYT5_9FIRM|nr:DUF6011 domain-containing protein [Thermanaeromonas toyohensis]SMB98004.1 hypothetical protein SAMN00808754_2074 [Thermanaeromonas toyohensis ToBE]